MKDKGLLFSTFCGEYVRLMLNKDDKQTINHSGVIKMVQNPFVLQGFLLDEDDDYFYIGYSPDVISSAILKKQVVVMELCEEEDEEAEELKNILDESVDVPEDENGVN